MTPPITSFTGPYRFLSNFYIEPDGTHVEGEFQSAKCADLRDVFRFRDLTPGQARRLGRTIQLRPDWEELQGVLKPEMLKVRIMRRLLWQKFLDHDDLRHLLRATDEAKLVHGNDHGDVFWGMCRGQGQNMLGILLMETRHGFIQ